MISVRFEGGQDLDSSDISFGMSPLCSVLLLVMVVLFCSVPLRGVMFCFLSGGGDVKLCVLSVVFELELATETLSFTSCCFRATSPVEVSLCCCCFSGGRGVKLCVLFVVSFFELATETL